MAKVHLKAVDSLNSRDIISALGKRSGWVEIEFSNFSELLEKVFEFYAKHMWAGKGKTIVVKEMSDYSYKTSPVHLSEEIYKWFLLSGGGDDEDIL